MGKNSKKLKLNQLLICGVDLELMVNRILDWSYAIYDRLYQGRKTELIQGKHLSSFSILTKIGILFREAQIDLDFAQPSKDESQRKRAVIMQEYVSGADFASLLNELTTDLAKRIAQANQLAGKWLPDEFTIGEIQAYHEAVGIIDYTLKEQKIKSDGLVDHFKMLVDSF